MNDKSRSSFNWGDLNVALNGLRKAGVIAGYKTGTSVRTGGLTIDVGVEPGADQADVVRRVREALPADVADAEVRTRAG